jgi:alginate O-acetyltransferase complex protein AlgJ
MRPRFGQICAVAAFALALVAPVLGQFWGWGTGGNAEVLAERPTFNPLNAAASITQSERWIDDNFGFRQPLIQLNSMLRSVVGASEWRDVLIGRDGWLFFRADDTIEQDRGVENFSDAELTQYVTVLDARRRWLERLGARMIMIIAPDKGTIYPEYMIPQMPQVAPTRLDQLIAATADTDITLLDLRPALKAAKSSGPLYYKADTHWTPLGAYVAANQVLRALHPIYPEIDSLNPGAWSFEYVYSAGGDMMPAFDYPWDVHERVPIVVRNFPDQVRYRGSEPIPQIPPVQGWSHDLDGSIAVTAHTDRPKLLIIGDSYSVSLLPFLQQEFSEVACLFARRDSAFDEYHFVERFRPDIVLFEKVERFLSDSPRNPPEVARAQ